MLIKVEATMNNCFDCRWISGFKEEKEYLFIGGRHPFKIVDVCIPIRTWPRLGKYMKAINRIQEHNHKIDDDIDQIKNKLLKIQQKVGSLSFEQLQNELKKFASMIIAKEDKNNSYCLVAVEWVVKQFHCYLNQS